MVDLEWQHPGVASRGPLVQVLQLKQGQPDSAAQLFSISSGGHSTMSLGNAWVLCHPYSKKPHNILMR